MAKKKKDHVVGAVVGIVAKALPLIKKLGPILQKVKALAKVGKAVGKLAGAIGLGGVTQDRFMARYTEIRDVFVKYGYLTLGSKFHEDALTRNKIRKTQITDKKTKGNYEPEFARLHKWVVEVMNNANPGFGDLYSEIIPAWPMANLGNIVNEPVEALKLLIENTPPGSFNVNTMSNDDIALLKQELFEAPSEPITKEVITAVNTEVLKPLEPVMVAGLKAAGVIPPNNTEDLAQMFYERVVKPSNAAASNYDFLDDSIVNAIVAFVTTAKNQREAGQPQNPIMNAIGETTAKVETRLEEKGKEVVDQKVGSWITDNILYIVIGLVLFAVALFFILKKR